MSQITKECGPKHELEHNDQLVRGKEKGGDRWNAAIATRGGPKGNTHYISGVICLVFILPEPDSGTREQISSRPQVRPKSVHKT